MLEPDVVIYTNDISFKPDERSLKQGFFEYIVAEDYRDTLVDLVFFDARKMDEPLTIEKADGSKLYSRTATRYNETDFMWYRLDIKDLLSESRDG
jgi:hypothetical protein